MTIRFATEHRAIKRPSKDRQNRETALVAQAVRDAMNVCLDGLPPHLHELACNLLIAEAVKRSPAEPACFASQLGKLAGQLVPLAPSNDAETAAERLFSRPDMSGLSTSKLQRVGR